MVHALLIKARTTADGEFSLTPDGSAFTCSSDKPNMPRPFRHVLTLTNRPENPWVEKLEPEKREEHFSHVLFHDILPAVVDQEYMLDNRCHTEPSPSMMTKAILGIIKRSKSEKTPDYAVMGPGTWAHNALYFKSPFCENVTHLCDGCCPEGEIYYIYIDEVFFVFHENYLFSLIREGIYLSWLELVRKTPRAVVRSINWSYDEA